MTLSMRAVALLVAFLLDSLLGDPPRLPHMVVAIGKSIERLEKIFRRVMPATPRGEAAGGTLLVCIVAVGAFALPCLALEALAKIDSRAAFLFEVFVCYQALAAKCLRDAGMKVHDALLRGDLDGARKAVAMIVGRDAATLDKREIARAAVETIAENASDGVIAPMFYFALGGAPLAVLYKAVNTMDSMLGYKNDRYLHFGRAAARLDDAANYAPARLTALLLVAAAALVGLDWRNAWRVYRRDHGAHSSPNAGHPEAACAGALGVRLGGDSIYFGRLVQKPTLGNARRDIEPEDIRRACRLLRVAAAFGAALCCAALFVAGSMPWN